MLLTGSTVLVTGANRGLGRRFAEALVARGATVFAAARRPESIDVPGVISLQLDVTDQASITAAVAAAEAQGGVSVVINNAGSSTGASLLDGELSDIRLEMDTHYFGTLAVTRAFAPQLAAHGGGAVLNVLSALSWASFPEVGAYCAAKSAEWSLTNALRQQLAEQGTQVAALHVGYMDTDMAASVTAPKSDPAAVAAIALNALEAGAVEILADDVSRHVQAGLAGGVTALYPQFAAQSAGVR